MRLLYSLFMYLATPFVLAYFAVRGLRDARYWSRWGERLGFSRPSGGPGAVIVHASSMGEVNAASPLVQAFLREHPGQAVMLTTFTPTGLARAQALFGESVAQRHLPLDLPGAMSRFLGREKPSLMLIMETEIWPNLFYAASSRQIPLAIVNARMSDQSLRGYRRIGPLIRPALGNVGRVLAQSDQDKRRFRQCGAGPDGLVVTGNLKFDVKVPASLSESGEILRAGWGITRPVLVAGSTHEEDESELFPAFDRVLEDFADALLVLAPRHPERFQDAARTARNRGLQTHCRSEGDHLPAGTQCLVVDSMGELLAYYAAADVTFVGGTITPLGGHNVLEPAALGKPVLFGPSIENVREISRSLLEQDCAVQVCGAADIARATRDLFADPARRDRMGQAGLALVSAGRGALDRTLVVVNELLAGAG